jgi:type II secretory pathway component PulM
MKLSTRERRIVIVGGAVLVVAGVLYFGDSILPNRAGQGGTLEQRKRTLVQYRETIGLEELYKARLEQYKQRLDFDQKRLLPGDNSSIAAAELQRILTDIAAQSGLEIMRRDIRRETKLNENLVKIAVNVEVNCTPESLVKFISSVENHEKALALDELSVTTFRIQKRYEIRPSITISGFILVPESKPERASSND